MSDGEIERSYSELRDLAYEDPLEAKAALCALLDVDLPRARAVMSVSDDVRGARFRQIAARSLQGRVVDEQLRSILESWRHFEHDEFALAAIRDVLQARQEKAKKRLHKSGPAGLSEIKDTYSYVSARMRHRVLNALPAGAISVEQLGLDFEEFVAAERRLDFRHALDSLYDRLMKLKNVIAFDDDLDRYFACGPIQLGAWLRSYCRKFLAVYDAEIGVVMPGGSEVGAVEATPYLLEIVFSNLWKNSWDELAPSRCKISNRITSTRSSVLVSCFDNGSGFPESMTHTAFAIYHSTKGDGRGRGLLEVHEAMQRMGGSAELVSTEAGLRVQLTFRGVSF